MSTALHECEHEHALLDFRLSYTFCCSKNNDMVFCCYVYKTVCKWLDWVKLLLHNEHVNSLSLVWTPQTQKRVSLYPFPPNT